MPHTFLNPTELHDPTPFGYSHTAVISANTELVLIAGQYGSSNDGTVVSAAFAEQVQRAFINLGASLAVSGRGCRCLPPLVTGAALSSARLDRDRAASAHA
jgi:enamine deaminase RidA (YjgF/YER057c/UK114 family)